MPVQKTPLSLSAVLQKMIEDVSNANDLQISLGVRQQLKKSSKIISDTTAFLGKLNKSLSSFGQFCGQGKEYQNEFFFAVIPVLEDLAFLFEGFGFAEKANGFRKNGAFIEKLVVSLIFLNQIGLLKIILFRLLLTILTLILMLIVVPLQLWQQSWMNLQKLLIV